MQVSEPTPICGDRGPLRNWGWPKPYLCTLEPGDHPFHESWEGGILMDWWATKEPPLGTPHPGPAKVEELPRGTRFCSYCDGTGIVP